MPDCVILEPIVYFPVSRVYRHCITVMIFDVTPEFASRISRIFNTHHRPWHHLTAPLVHPLTLALAFRMSLLW